MLWAFVAAVAEPEARWPTGARKLKRGKELEMPDPSDNRARTGWKRGRRVFLAAAIATVAAAGTAYGAFVGLPSNGTLVNNDPPTIDPAQNVNVSDLTGGSLAGGARVPWAAFAQAQAGSSAVNIVVRAFKGGVWQTEGFPESLNFDSTQDAQSPSIDFTGANRTVPWVTWDEPVAALGSVQNIFASRFASQPAPAQNGGQWVLEGQTRASSVQSLNVNTNREAVDPSLIGGTTTAGGNPAPWVTWQEADNGNQSAPTGNPANPNVAGDSRFQIFVSHAVAASGGACPAGTQPVSGGSGTTPHNFCFQDVGIPRVTGPSALDPSLNVDPTRDGIEADIAFTGANDSVPWVVWYENSDNGTTTNGLLNADMVFAARAVADANGNGGFHWQVVGLGTAGKTPTDDVLDAGQSGHGLLGECAQSVSNEQACSLDTFPAGGLTDGNGAENPEVTAGTLVAGKPTTPWVTWDESSTNGGLHSVFVARLDAAGDHFDLLNNGQPISHSGLDSTRPDIVFAGNTPYVSWHETNAVGQTVTFVGHFEGNPADPVFHIDTPSIANTPQGAADDDTTDVRSPIASTCPDDPFTGDGSTCSGGAVGTPFFAYTDNASGPQSLFAQGYTPGATTTGAPSAVTETTASVAGSVSTDGAPTLVHFDFGTSTAYGSTTAPQLLAPASGVSTPVVGALAGLPAGTVIHYRVAAQTDFGTVDGQDATFKTTAPPPLKVGKPTASHASLSGVAKRKAKLAFTLAAGSNAAAIKTISVSLPKGLGFSHKTKTLTKGITVASSSGKHLKLRLGLSHGTLKITLKSAATSVRVTIRAPAITVTAKLARAAKHKKVKRLNVIVKLTNTSNKTTRFSLRLKLS
jgi:hypothetical protein